MTHPLAGIRQKVFRAHEHLTAIKSEIAAHKKNCSVIRRPNVDPNLVDLIAEFPEPRINLSIFIGDCLYNLRSCLDHLVWQLVECCNSPARGSSSNLFPICDNAAIFQAVCGQRLKGVPKNAQTEIENLQPYKVESCLSDSHLWCVNHLGNIDKHRFLPTTSVTAQTMLGDIKPSVNSRGVNVWTVPFAAADKLEMELNEGISVAFKDAPLAGRDVGIYMEVMIEYIGKVVLPTFNPMFQKE